MDEVGNGDEDVNIDRSSLDNTGSNPAQPTVQIVNRQQRRSQAVFVSI
jgi:hypothetical protein